MALNVMRQRYPKYGDSWKRNGWKGNVADMLRKAERVRKYMWENDNFVYTGDYEEDELSDLIDMMNYAAFAIRNVLNENKYGENIL